MDLRFPQADGGPTCTFQLTATSVSPRSIIDLCCYNHFSTLLIKTHKFNTDHRDITKHIDGSSVPLELWVFGLWKKWRTSWQNWTEHRSLMRLRTAPFTLHWSKTHQFFVYLVWGGFGGYLQFLCTALLRVLISSSLIFQLQATAQYEHVKTGHELRNHNNHGSLFPLLIHNCFFLG